MTRSYVPKASSFVAISLLAASVVCLVPSAARGAAQAAQARFTVTGVVQDQTNAVLRGTEVTLAPAGAGGQAPRVTRANDAGAFRFDDVPAGTYELRAQFEGFTPAKAQLRVGPRQPGRQRLVLQIAGVEQEITVGTQSATLALDASQNRDGVTVDKRMLAEIPIFDRDVVGAISALLDPAAAGTGGTTLVVDGMEGRKVGVPASAIQQVKINQDAYSAEFARPGHGRVEIVTKAGSDQYHGEVNLTFRDSRMNARNAFAESRPPEQRRILEAVVGGPILGGRTTSFMLTLNREETDQQAIVFAQGLLGPIRGTVQAPQRNLELSATVNHQQGTRHTLSLRADYQAESALNEGVGGTTLAESGSDSRASEFRLIYSHRTMLTGRLVNQLRLLVGGDHQRTAGANGRPAIVVQDAFSGGSSQANQLEEERQFTLNDTLAWSRGRHALKGGIAIPDWSRRNLDDRGNFGGTFTFASLSDFAAGKPFRFTQQRGDGTLRLTQKLVAMFVQDDVAVRRNLSVAFGVRYDWQNFFGDDNNVSPRASFAWSPGSRPGTVVRGGAGVFYDRTGVGPMSDVIRSREGRLSRYVLLDPGYPEPLAPGAALATQPTSLVRLSPGLSFPYTVQFGVGVERQIAKATTVALNYTGARGVDLFRSLDVNAPPPPFYVLRPDPTHGVVREIQSAGRQWNHTLQATVRGKVLRYFTGSIQYAIGQAKNDTGGIGSYPANNYDLSGEWSRADFDQRHRFDAVGSVKAGRWFALGVNLSLRSGRPYTLRTGSDDFNDGTTNARPAGVPRNGLEGPGSARLDVRWSREVAFGGRGEDGPKVTVGLDAFNVLNRVNYNGFVGNQKSPFFGRPTSAQAPRRLQLSLRVEY